MLGKEHSELLKEIEGRKDGKNVGLIPVLTKGNFHLVNEAINKNKERFKNNIDIVDLKSVDLIDRDLLKELGMKANNDIARKFQKKVFLY